LDDEFDASASVFAWLFVNRLFAAPLCSLPCRSQRCRLHRGHSQSSGS
jgi:hypothetical protein